MVCGYEIYGLPRPLALWGQPDWHDDIKKSWFFRGSQRGPKRAKKGQNNQKRLKRALKKPPYTAIPVVGQLPMVVSLNAEVFSIDWPQ